VLSHEGVEGNEQAEENANAGDLGNEQGVKAIAEKYKEMSLTTIQKKITQAKWSDTERWWKANLNEKAVYRMNKKKKRKLAHEVSLAKKTIVSRYLQLKVGHSLTAIYLEQIKKKESLECCSCQHKRQMRDHLFKWCKQWKRQQDVLWKKLKKKCKRTEGRLKVPMSQVFNTE
jgi:hypothetical protein